MIHKAKKLIYKIFKPHKYAEYIGVKIGKNTEIYTRNWPTEPYLIEIGNHCQITRDVSIHTHGGGNVIRKKYPDFDVFGKVRIKDWAYIGSGSHIMPGVTIGEGALIAAGSVVTKSVPDGEVWGGNPARYICKVEDYIARNVDYNLNSKRLSPAEKKKLLLSLPEDKFLRK